MRSFKLQVSKSVGNKQDVSATRYVISLDRDIHFYFSNKKNAEVFRVKLEKFYTNYCYLINDLYITTIQNFRFYFFELKPFELRLIKEYQKEIDNNFDYLLSQAKTTNSNYFKYGRFISIFDSMSSINAFLSNKARIKQDRNMERKCKSFELHLLEIRNSSSEFNEEHLNIHTYDSTLEIIHDKRHA